MKRVTRQEILDYVTYEEQRDKFRKKIMKIKELRRINVAGVLSFLFENTDTVRYQIQEMMRVECIVKETDIQHEINTYNELLGDSGELGCTLFIEIDDPDKRDEKLHQWLELPKHLFLSLEDESKIRASFDEKQIGDARLSSVQYIKFNTGGETPVAIGSDLPLFKAETTLTADQKKALSEDLL
ncbi:MAG: DUF3501 family protein [SAR324 cluster bacterium]|jgi:hypothetical protein|nr:DUF3501 family protein [SAR324 cluster bacterium]|tara:strand:+ start:782 stop:1333 length:552 start_codon:yes stop_codon:yes gene_type:complete